MSVISLPRRVERGRALEPPTRSRRGARHRATAPRRAVVANGWRAASAVRKSVIIVVASLSLALFGTMLEANRQVEIHSLDSQLLQLQSNYAVHVGSLTNLSAPSLIATKAGALHLVSPTSVTQIPSTGLDVPLPLPKFSGSATATSRTLR